MEFIGLLFAISYYKFYEIFSIRIDGEKIDDAFGGFRREFQYRVSSALKQSKQV